MRSGAFSYHKERENVLYRSDASQEVQHFQGVASRTIEKVQAIAHLFNSDCVFLSVMFQDELLEV